MRRRTCLSEILIASNGAAEGRKPVRKLNTIIAGPVVFKVLASATVLVLVSSWAWTQESVSGVSAASVDKSFSAFHQTLTATASELLTSTQHEPAVKHTHSDSLLNFGLRKPDEKEEVLRGIELRQAVERVQKQRPVFEPILREEGVPQQLAALVLVESGGWSTALSPKGARGLWQLMPDTARRYGLLVTSDHDERLDIYKSTRAAARYLRELHEQFKDWSLVFAAYNAGEQKVQSAIERSGANDFSRLSSLLPTETRNYVPAVWASLARLGYQDPVHQLVSLSNSRTGVRVVYADSGSSYREATNSISSDAWETYTSQARSSVYEIQ